MEFFIWLSLYTATKGSKVGKRNYFSKIHATY